MFARNDKVDESKLEQHLKTKLKTPLVDTTAQSVCNCLWDRGKQNTLPNIGALERQFQVEALLLDDLSSWLFMSVNKITTGIDPVLVQSLVI